MMQTGPACGNLSTGVSERVLQRVNQIVRSNSIPDMLLSWVENAVASGNFAQLSRELQNELLDTLHVLAQSGSEVAQPAQQLYAYIIGAHGP
jgi:hypothetical protein